MASSEAKKKKAKSGQLAASDYRALAEFRFQLRTFLTFAKDAAEKAGLAPQQHQALLVIKGFPDEDEPTIGYLAERLLIRHHSAVGLVDRLAKAGYLKRNPGRQDRRKVTLSLTPRGEAVLARLAAASRDELRRLALLKPLLALVGK
jgi:DNA-binding MarR family transcriptional regulator